MSFITIDTMQKINALDTSSVNVDINDTKTYTPDEAINLLMEGFFEPIKLSREQNSESTFYFDWKCTDEMFDALRMKVNRAFNSKSKTGLNRSLNFFINRIKSSVESSNSGVSAVIFFAPFTKKQVSIRIPVTINSFSVRKKTQKSSSANTYTVIFKYIPLYGNFSIVDTKGSEPNVVDMRKYNVELFKQFEENIYDFYNRLVRELFLGEGAFWRTFRETIHKVYANYYQNKILFEMGNDHVYEKIASYAGITSNMVKEGKSLVSRFCRGDSSLMPVWEYIYRTTYEFQLTTEENKEYIGPIRAGTNVLSSRHRTACVPYKKEVEDQDTGDTYMEYFNRIEGEFKFDEIDGSYYYSSSNPKKVPFGARRFNGFSFIDTRNMRYNGVKYPDNYPLSENEDIYNMKSFLNMIVDAYNNAYVAAEKDSGEAAMKIVNQGALIRNPFGENITILGSMVFNIGVFKIYWASGELPAISNKATITNMVFTTNITRSNGGSVNDETVAMREAYLSNIRKQNGGEDDGTSSDADKITQTDMETNEAAILSTIEF